MLDIVVFISSDFNDCDTKKIAELMHIHKIKTTTNINDATVMLAPVNNNTKKTKPTENQPPKKRGITIADIAQQLVDVKIQELEKLKNDIITYKISPHFDPVIITVKTKQKTRVNNSVKNFKQVRQYYNTKRFNRTKNK